MSSAAERPVVIGVGNRWRRDDGVGVVVAERLRRRGIAAHACEGEPVELLELLTGAGAAVIVDAAAAAGAPGRVHRVDAVSGPLPAALSGTSTHALGIADAIELARTLDRLPGQLDVIGIEGADFTAGVGLTAEVDAAADAVVDALS